MTDKIWNFRNKTLNERDIDDMADTHGIPRVLAVILLNRSITADKAAAFLRKSMSDIVNPMLMKDMDKAARRINSAVDNGEKIAVYGDYDVDGITATALMYDFLSRLGADVEYYIPDRRDEGYGINIMAVNTLLKKGVNLMITVDCGITAIGEAEFAKLQHMDMIITDHHTCKDRLPTAAAAILNPKRPDCEYPFKSLAGVGVAFKLILAVAMERGMNTNDVFTEYADLATLGTIADVVPLTDENRVITDKGLKLLSDPKRVGIDALMDIAGVKNKPVNASVIAFGLAPRLNAAGRLGSAADSVKLLLTKNAAEAEKLAAALDDENKERQITEKRIFDEALEMIAADADFEKKKVIVLAHEDWHRGVIGIVASRLCDMYYKPCILISHSNGVGKGSGRSIKTFNLFDALSHCEKHLVEFGGHAVAAGLNINMSDLDKFIKEINRYADETLGERDMIPTVDIDCPLSERAVTIANAKLISKLEPFGMGNEKPVFAIAGAQIANVSAIGMDNKHLRLRAIKNNKALNCIGFGMGKYASELEKGDVVNLAFHMDINSYQGTESVQLILKDIKRR